VPSNRRPSDRKPDANRTNITPIRIEVAKSGDLAYEYSDARLGFEMKDGRKVEIPTSILRVWRKEGGQWKVAAQFGVRHYDESIDKQ
jgi:ketosteroid isomerase-like protein